MSDPIEDAAAAALRGALIVLPTDTVYGLGTCPDDPSATARLFDAKARPRALALPILVASVEAAAQVAEIDERAERLAITHWPGPLTIVLRRNGTSAAWQLGGEADSIGVRVPRHPLALGVLSRTGPLAVTSANRSGRPTPSTCEELAAMFGDAVAVYLCEEAPLAGKASTVVDLAHGEPAVLRAGDIDAAELAAFMGS